jgi:hypothetical protein
VDRTILEMLVYALPPTPVQLCTPVASGMWYRASAKIPFTDAKAKTGCPQVLLTRNKT